MNVKNKISSSLFFLFILISEVILAFPTNSIKWHPGHYYTITNGKNNTTTFLPKLYEELQNTPALRGVQMRYTWAELETSPGAYQFTSIQNRLNELKAINKRLVIQIQIKSFSPTVQLVPSYILNKSDYEGGVFKYAEMGTTVAQGEVIRLWNVNLKNRLIALIQALGAKFNSDPYFEAISIIDTSYPKSLITITSAQLDSFYSNLAEVNIRMREAFPNTVSLQEASFPVDRLNSLVLSLKSTGAGLSASRVLPDDDYLNYVDPKDPTKNGVYSYFNTQQKFIPLAARVDAKDYLNTASDGSGMTPNISEIIQFANNKLKANYIFWTRNSDVTAINIKAELTKPLYQNDPIGVGALRFQCPGKFIACSSPVKWHPGHYYALQAPEDPWYMDKVYSELDKTPAMRGVLIRLYWADLEKNFNQYDFSLIDNLLANLSLSGRQKRLILRIQHRTFDLADKLIPQYVKDDPKYDDGQIYYSGKSDGYNLKLWNPFVVERVKALIYELGRRYNSHPYFEGIGLAETSLGFSMTSQQENDYFKNFIALDQSIRKNFPNTMNYQFVNHPAKWVSFLVGSLNFMGAGLGGPDTFINEPELNDGVYSYYPSMSGVIPLTPSVQPDNYRRSCSMKYNNCPPPTVDQLLAFARDNLKANYLYWTRDKEYYQNVLDLLNKPAQRDAPSGAGGLEYGCPSAYISCLRD